ncbi:MAG: cytochrome c biogenesis protein CcdA [Deltaproteobacteria bacterium]|nr:cytochrome c biogenesis protein CcdA [Deltaproteobacteria bacterium]
MNFGYSFLAGILSFFSPCVLPLLPSYLVYIGGINLNDTFSFNEKRRSLVLHTIFFVFGFSLVFISFGLAGNILGKMLIHYKTYLILFGGLILIFFGLFIMGILNISFLGRHISLNIKQRHSSLFGSFFVGLAFALGWSPCIGPALSSVLILALGAETTLEALFILVSYCLGLGIPFILSSFGLGVVLSYFLKITSLSRYVKLILGALLVVVGISMILSIYLPFTQKFLKLLNVF